MGAAGASKVDELFGSLGILIERKPPTAADSVRKRAYISVLAAIVFHERSRGVSLAEIERRWSITSLEGMDESWRDSALWLVAGHANLLDVRAFYHHLREHRAANVEQVKATKQASHVCEGRLMTCLRD